MAATAIEWTLMRRFFLPRAPTVEARLSGTLPILFSRLNSQRAHPERSLSPRQEDAFAFHIPLITTAFSAFKYGSKSVDMPAVQGPGQVLVINLRDKPTASLPTVFDTVRCYISQRTIDDLARENGSRPVHDLVQRSFGDRDPLLFHLGSMLVPVLEDVHRAGSAFVEYVALAFYEHIVATYGSTRVTERQIGGLAPWQIRRACDFIEAELHSDPSIARLSKECNLSQSYFTRAFRKSVGMAPHQWILKQRILRAKELLLSSEHSIAEIAVQCGFVDQSHLGRVFSREFSMSPAKWRRLFVEKRYRST